MTVLTPADVRSQFEECKPDMSLLHHGRIRPAGGGGRAWTTVLVDRGHDPGQRYDRFVVWSLILQCGDASDPFEPYCVSGDYHNDLREALAAFDKREGA